MRLYPVLLQFIILTLLPLTVDDLCLASNQAVPAAQASVGGLAGIRVLDLDTARRIAVSSNPTLAAANSRVMQARYRLDQAKSAWWPRLDATGSVMRVELSQNEQDSNLAQARLFNPNASIDDPTDVYSAGLSVNWLVFDGLSRKFTNDLAALSVSQSELAHSDAKRILLSSVAATYFTAQLSREEIAIATADEAFNQRQLVDAEARRLAGTGSLSDELNFKIRVNEARTTLITAKRAFDAAMYSLAALLGIPHAIFPPELELASLAPEIPLEMSPPDVVASAAFARKNRPDIRIQKLGIRRAEAEEKVARSAFFPALNLAGSYDGTRREDGFFESDDFGNTVGLSLSYNLFSGGLDRGKIREARAKKDESEKLLEDILNNLEADIHSAASRVRAAQEQLSLQRDNVVLVEETRNLVETEYSAGQGSLVRLNEAQRDLTRARSRLALALVSLRQAWEDFYSVTGEILIRYAR